MQQSCLLFHGSHSEYALGLFSEARPGGGGAGKAQGHQGCDLPRSVSELNNGSQCLNKYAKFHMILMSCGQLGPPVIGLDTRPQIQRR